MTIPIDYFESMYEDSADPWGFASRWYEQRKYALTLASLPDARYGTAYEPGCSIGVLSRMLADRCDRLLCSDGSAVALARAAQRLSGQAHVTVEQRRLPDDWPSTSFDLVIVSELLYYFDFADLDRVATLAAGSVASGGTLVSVHWRHPVPDHPQSGDTVHTLLTHTAVEHHFVRVTHLTETDFLLDVYVRPGAGESGFPSVASRDGLL